MFVLFSFVFWAKIVRHYFSVNFLAKNTCENKLVSVLLGSSWNSIREPCGSQDPTLRTTDMNFSAMRLLFEWKLISHRAKSTLVAFTWKENTKSDPTSCYKLSVLLSVPPQTPPPTHTLTQVSVLKLQVFASVIQPELSICTTDP